MKTDNHTSTIIRAEMRRCGYTLEALTEETEISKAVLQGILSDRAKSISTRTICSLARTFGYSAAEFMDLLSGNSPK